MTRLTLALVLVLTVGALACETRERSTFRYSGSYVLCDPLEGSLVDTLNFYDWTVTTPVKVRNADARYQIKIVPTDKMYKVDLPVTAFLSYQQFRPDTGGVLQPVGIEYVTPLDCKNGKCRSQKGAFLAGFDAEEDDVIKMGFRIADNSEGFPALLRPDTQLDFSVQYKFQ